MDANIWYVRMNQEYNEYKISADWVGPYDEYPPCSYNKSVGCRNQRCETCGWNPVVSIERIKSKYGSYAVKFLTEVEI